MTKVEKKKNGGIIYTVGIYGDVMQKSIFYLIVFSFIFFNGTVLALECNNDDKERLQKLANNIGVILEEVDNKGELYFNATFTGVAKGLMIISSDDVIYPGVGTDKEIVINNLSSNTNYNFEIKGSNVNSCFDTTFRKVTLNLPKYNIYYKDQVCNDIPEYSLCQKWNSTDISYDEFLDKVSKYKNNKKEIKIDKQIEINKKFNFLAFYKKYYWYAFGGLLIILGLLIYFWIKENKRNKL